MLSNCNYPNEDSYKEIKPFLMVYKKNFSRVLMKIKKIVITAAGKGTRLLPLTKEMPKEMLPIYVNNKRKTEGILKPILHLIFDSAYEHGIRDFCLIVGKGKRSIEDHFLIPDQDFGMNKQMKEFILRIKDSSFTYVQQSSPKGFGDAVLKAESFVNQENFLVHAGDDAILSIKNNHLQRLQDAFFRNDADIALLVTKTKEPHLYGIIKGKKKKNIIQVTKFEEKPKNQISGLATVGIYIFKPTIFNVLKKIKPDKKNEIQLADAIKTSIEEGANTIAIELGKDEKRVDVGTPESYTNCMIESYKFFKNIKL